MQNTHPLTIQFIASTERATLRERQLEGIAKAKKNGVYKNRIKDTTESREIVMNSYKEVVCYLKMNKKLRDIAGQCQVPVGMVQKVKALIV